MTIVIDFEEYLWLSYVILPIVWYMVAGKLIKKYGKQRTWYGDDYMMYGMMWLCSPLVFLIMFASLPLYVLSCGVIRPFWKWKS